MVKFEDVREEEKREEEKEKEKNRGDEGTDWGVAEKRDEELEELMKKLEEYVENYSKTLKELEQLEEPLEIFEKKLDRYGFDERVKEKVLQYFLPAIAHSYFPSEVKPHILLQGPPGTGKSYLVNEIARVLGVIVYELDVSAVDSAREISLAFWRARKVRRASLAIEMKKRNLKLEDIIKEAAKELEVEEEVLKEYIKNKKDLLDIIQPIDPSATTNITSLKEAIKGKSKLDEEFITENYIIATFNKILKGVPVLVVMDEIDSLGERDLRANPVLNQLLKEIDASSLPSFNNGITCIGITNRPLLIDAALTRSGRLQIVDMRYPNKEAKGKIVEVIMKRFYDPNVSFGSKEEKEEIINMLASIPFSTGADIKKLLEDVIRQKRANMRLGKRIDIKKEEILELLKKANADKKQIGRFILIEDRLKLLEKLEGHEEKKPVLVEMRDAFFEVFKKKADELVKVIADRLIQEKERKEKSKDSIEDEGIVILYNALTRALPTTVALSHLIHYLEGKIRDEKGAVIGFDSEEICLMMKDSLAYLALKNFAEKKDDPYVKASIDASDVLHGIVSVTPKNLAEIVSYVKQTEKLILHIKNAAILYGTGAFNLEHSPKFIELLKEAKERKGIIFYASPRYDAVYMIDLINNSDYRLDLYTSNTTSYIKGEEEIIELIGSKKDKPFLAEELRHLYEEIINSLIEILKVEDLRDPSKVGKEYVKTCSVLWRSYGLDRYLSTHKEVKKLVQDTVGFGVETSPHINELREKFKEYVRRRKGEEQILELRAVTDKGKNNGGERGKDLN